MPENWLGALREVERPQQYIGMEYNGDQHVEGRAVTLVYPDVYEIGASNFGLQVVRHLLLRAGGFSVGRAFHPSPDMHRIMLLKGLPWIDLEHYRPVAESSVVGFGVSSEILYTNVLSLIQLMGLPLRSALRSPDAPLLLAGGGGLSNPVPLMPFMDVIFLGEAEEGAAQLFRLLCSNMPRTGKLEAAAELPGVLVPSLHRGGTIKWVRAKRLTTQEAPVDQVVPVAGITHDRAVVEIARGCTRGCRFCQASQLSRPVRERDPRQIFGIIEGAVSSTGWEKAGALTLSFSDHSCIGELLEGFRSIERRLHVAVTHPSLRPDTLALLGNRGKMAGSLTMAPEAGTERLRRVINKPLTDRQIMEAAETASSMGARGLKLYFMVGLPGETDEDLAAIASLADRISGVMGRKRQVSVALSPFVPKPHTPFQWCQAPGHFEMKRRIDLVKGLLKRASVSWNDPRVSAVESLLARGGTETADILESAFRDGAVFDGWSDLFRWDVWKRYLPVEDASADAAAVRAFPWEFVDTGVDRAWLLADYERSLDGTTLPDCRIEGCSSCGACSGDVPPIELQAGQAFPSARMEEKTAAASYRVRYGKTGPAVFTSHLDMIRLWTRTLRRSGLPLHYSSGFSRRVKLAFSHPLPLGMGSSSEYLDFKTEEEVSVRMILESLKWALPQGIKILTAVRLHGRYRPPDSQTEAAEYIISGVNGVRELIPLLRGNELVLHCSSAGENDIMIVTDPRKGAARPDRLLQEAGFSWHGIERTNLCAVGENGQYLPLVPLAEGENNEG